MSSSCSTALKPGQASEGTCLNKTILEIPFELKNLVGMDLKPLVAHYVAKQAEGSTGSTQSLSC